MNFKTFVFMILTFRRVDPIPKNIGLMLSITFWISIVWIISKDHCAGCCFYNEGCCSIRDFDHIDFPDCHNSGMIWMQKEINMSDIKEKAIKLAIDAMKPIPICSSPCYNISDNRSPEEKHEEEMRFCKDLNDLRCEMLIDMAKKIEEYLS